jgi:CBS domain-containing protein
MAGWYRIDGRQKPAARCTNRLRALHGAYTPPEDRSIPKEDLMARYVRDVMTQRPVTLQTTDTVIAAARSMRDGNIGDVVVLEEDRIQGILTDRDIVVRAVANDAVGDAEKIMRDRAIRRLPVVEREGPVGIMSLDGLAVEQNPESMLGGISAAPPNR